MLWKPLFSDPDSDLLKRTPRAGGSGGVAFQWTEPGSTPPHLPTPETLVSARIEAGHRLSGTLVGDAEFAATARTGEQFVLDQDREGAARSREASEVSAVTATQHHG